MSLCSPSLRPPSHITAPMRYQSQSVPRQTLLNSLLRSILLHPRRSRKLLTPPSRFPPSSLLRFPACLQLLPNPFNPGRDRTRPQETTHTSPHQFSRLPNPHLLLLLRSQRRSRVIIHH